MNEQTLEAVQEKLGYRFKRPDLLIQAFIRRSWSEENGRGFNNEILEFIGDRALDLAITKKLIGRYGRISRCFFPKTELGGFEEYADKEDSRKNAFYPFYCGCDSGTILNEGWLTEKKALLVCTASLSEATDRLGLAEHLITSAGDKSSGAALVDHVKEDLYEALIGAVTLDSDWDLSAVEGVVDRTLEPDKKLDEGLSEADHFGELEKLGIPFTPPVFETKPYDSGVVCRTEIDPLGGLMLFNVEASGFTEAEARAEAGRIAYRTALKAKKDEKLFSDIADGSFYREDRAINTLQELWQKGYIGKPYYSFERIPVETDTMWRADFDIPQSSVDRNHDATEYPSKLEAKKHAAEDALMQLQCKGCRANVLIQKEAQELYDVRFELNKERN